MATLRTKELKKMSKEEREGRKNRHGEYSDLPRTHQEHAGKIGTKRIHKTGSVRNTICNFQATERIIFSTIVY